MEEKRRYKRLELDVSIELERLDENGITIVKYSHADVVDISRSGIGFKAAQKLELGVEYRTKIQIWTREVIEVAVKVIRMNEIENGYRYGGVFVGLTDTDALKIDIYQIFNDY